MEQLIQLFLQKGFSPAQLNATGISLFLKDELGVTYALLLLYMDTAGQWNSDKCSHIESQLAEQIYQQRQQSVEFYTFLITNHIEDAREICRSNHHTGIIDISQKRLLIFEDMKEDRFHLYPDMDCIIRDIGENQMKAVPKGTTTSIRSVLSQVGIINLIIIVINILVYGIAKVFDCYDDTIESGGLFWYYVFHEHEYYRVLTSMFLHGGISHLANNMLVLGCIGGILEAHIGKVKYLILYLLSGMIAGIVSMRYNMEKARFVYSIGASGAIFGVIGAVLLIVLVNKGKVQNISRRQMILFVIFSLYGGFSAQNVDNIAHIGGLIAGFIIALILYRKPKRRSNVA